MILGFFLFAIVITALYRAYSNDKTQREYQARVEMFLDDYRTLNPTRYSYADLKRITNQFSDELGQGAYGTVFKGKLTNEISVAVKLLNNSIGKGEEFINEVGTMARIHHVNVVRLIGFCADGFRRALVYEYLPNDSLQYLPNVRILSRLKEPFPRLGKVESCCSRHSQGDSISSPGV